MVTHNRLVDNIEQPDDTHNRNDYFKIKQSLTC